MSKPKTTAQDSDAVVHDDADIPGMVSEHVDREAYPEGLDDDTMLIRFSESAACFLANSISYKRDLSTLSAFSRFL